MIRGEANFDDPKYQAKLEKKEDEARNVGVFLGVKAFNDKIKQQYGDAPTREQIMSFFETFDSAFLLNALWNSVQIGGLEVIRDTNFTSN